MTPPFIRRSGVATALLLTTIGGARCARPDHASLGSEPSKPVEVRLAGAPALDSVVTRACGDCHSNSMSPGWYTRVPPFSSAMSRGAAKGREAVNFAEWAKYTPEQRRALLAASCADAKSGKMPMGSYLRFRPEAKLSERDIATICEAAR